MNITELRYLVAIAQNGSVSAAAKQLYVAQPNVSKALKSLEDEYGLRVFERTSTGMLPTEGGRRFIAQAERVLEEIGKLEQDAHYAHGACTELRAVIPQTTYASYAAADFLQQEAAAAQLRVHIRECSAADALGYVLRKGYHLALIRYSAEDEEVYALYCRQHGLQTELIMEFDSYLLTNQDSPLATHEITDLSELNDYIEVLPDDGQLPDGRISGARAAVNPNRRVHIYERCSQFSVLQSLPRAYMWAAPTPQHALEQYHLTLRRCAARRHKMRDVLVYPQRGLERPAQQLFAQLLRRQAQQAVR